MTNPHAKRLDIQGFLNEHFYATNPGTYFNAKASEFLRVGGELREPPEPGSWQARVAERLGDDWEIGDGSSSEQRAGTQALAAFMLAHHAGETTVRHFLANIQARMGRQPWLLLASLQSPHEFRKRLKEIIAKETPLREYVEYVFFPDRQSFVEQAGEQRVDASISFVTAWIRYFTNYYLRTSQGYNSAKHGLSSLPASMRVSFQADLELKPSDSKIIEGMTLTTLESRPTQQKGQRAWYRVVRAVDPIGLIASVFIASELLTWMYDIGRASTTGEAISLSLPTHPMPADVVRAKGDPAGELSIPAFLLPANWPPSAAADNAAGNEITEGP